MPKRKTIDENNHITSVHVSSKRTINIKKTGEYYSFECGIDGDVADMTPQERDKYIEFLWDKANTEIDNQVLDVAKCYDIES